jgi:NADPH2:quinone reductase
MASAAAVRRALPRFGRRESPQAERDPALISRNLAELLRWWEAGRLKPLVAKVFPLPEAGEALTAVLSHRYAGKIVLET